MSETVKRGTVLRNMREDDRIYLSIGGREIGSIFIARVPHDAKVKVGFELDIDVKVGTRRIQEDAK